MADSPQDQNPGPERKPLDLNSILLPKKEGGPSPLSAQRVNAGALLEQEAKAAAGEREQAVVTPQRDAISDSEKEQPPGAGAPVVPPALNPDASVGVPTKTSGKEESSVHAVETYTTDINRVVQSGGVSAVSIAAAEAERRAKVATQGEPVAPSLLSQEEKTSRWRIALIVGGALLILAALGVVAALLWRAAPQTPAATAVQAPFISVDQVTPVPVPAGVTRDILMTQLEAAREQVSLAVGLLAQLNVGTASTSGQQEPMPVQDLLATLAPDIPQDLLRTILPTYLLGVHSYDENQSLLVLRVDSYQQAYSGLLAWEPSMQQDLLPLFSRHPSPHLPPAGTQASSTAATSTPTTTQELLQTGFTDQVVENHDARVILNSTGDILLLWTFLDRNTVVITTNDATLREIIRRSNTPSVVPQP